MDETIRGLYKEGADGKFRLELEGAETDEEVAGLRSALQKERDRAKTYEARLKKLPDGFDPDKDLEELTTLRKEREGWGTLIAVTLRVGHPPTVEIAKGG